MQVAAPELRLWPHRAAHSPQTVFFPNLSSTELQEILCLHVSRVHPLDRHVLLPHGMVGSPGKGVSFCLNQGPIQNQADGKMGSTALLGQKELVLRE